MTVVNRVEKPKLARQSEDAMWRAAVVLWDYAARWQKGEGVGRGRCVAKQKGAVEATSDRVAQRKKNTELL